MNNEGQKEIVPTAVMKPWCHDKGKQHRHDGLMAFFSLRGRQQARLSVWFWEPPLRSTQCSRSVWTMFTYQTGLPAAHFSPWKWKLSSLKQGRSLYTILSAHYWQQPGMTWPHLDSWVGVMANSHCSLNWVKNHHGNTLRSISLRLFPESLTVEGRPTLNMSRII